MAISITLFGIFLTMQSIFSGATFPRYFIGAIPLVYLCIGYFSKLKLNQLVILNSLIFFIFIFGWNTENIFDKARPDVREVSKIIEDICVQENIKVYVPHTFETPLYDYYFKKRGVCELVKSPSYISYFEDQICPLYFRPQKITSSKIIG